MAWTPVVIFSTRLRASRNWLPVMKPISQSFRAASRTLSTLASESPLMAHSSFFGTISRLFTVQYPASLAFLMSPALIPSVASWSISRMSSASSSTRAPAGASATASCCCCIAVSPPSVAASRARCAAPRAISAGSPVGTVVVGVVGTAGVGAGEGLSY